MGSRAFSLWLITAGKELHLSLKKQRYSIHKHPKKLLVIKTNSAVITKYHYTTFFASIQVCDKIFQNHPLALLGCEQ